MESRKRLTISDLRAIVELREFDDEVCQLAITKMMQNAEWFQHEFTDEEIKNAVRAYLKERGFKFS